MSEHKGDDGYTMLFGTNVTKSDDHVEMLGRLDSQLALCNLAMTFCPFEELESLSQAEINIAYLSYNAVCDALNDLSSDLIKKHDGNRQEILNRLNASEKDLINILRQRGIKICYFVDFIFSREEAILNRCRTESRSLERFFWRFLEERRKEDYPLVGAILNRIASVHFYQACLWHFLKYHKPVKPKWKYRVLNRLAQWFPKLFGRIVF